MYSSFEILCFQVRSGCWFWRRGKKRKEGTNVCPLSELDLFSNCEIRYSVFSCFPGRANYKHCDRAKMLLLLLKQKRKWHKNRNKNSSERERQRNPPFRSWLLWRARASRSWKHFNEAAINTEVYSFCCKKSPKFRMDLDRHSYQFPCRKFLNLDLHQNHCDLTGGGGGGSN